MFRGFHHKYHLFVAFVPLTQMSLQKLPSDIGANGTNEPRHVVSEQVPYKLTSTVTEISDCSDNKDTDQLRGCEAGQHLFSHMQTVVFFFHDMAQILTTNGIIVRTPENLHIKFIFHLGIYNVYFQNA